MTSMSTTTRLDCCRWSDRLATMAVNRTGRKFITPPEVKQQVRALALANPELSPSELAERVPGVNERIVSYIVRDLSRAKSAAAREQRNQAREIVSRVVSAWTEPTRERPFLGPDDGWESQWHGDTALTDAVRSALAEAGLPATDSLLRHLIQQARNPHKPRKPSDADILEQLRRDPSASYTGIARKLSVDKERVSRMAHEHGLQRKAQMGTGSPDAQLREIARRIATDHPGWTPRQISDLMPPRHDGQRIGVDFVSQAIADLRLAPPQPVYIEPIDDIDDDDDPDDSVEIERLSIEFHRAALRYLAGMEQLTGQRKERAIAFRDGLALMVSRQDVNDFMLSIGPPPQPTKRRRAATPPPEPIAAAQMPPEPPIEPPQPQTQPQAPQSVPPPVIVQQLVIAPPPKPDMGDALAEQLRLRALRAKMIRSRRR